MLQNGQFIKEPPPRIGAYYVPQRTRDSTPEERFTQDVLLGVNPHNTNLLEKLVGKLLQI